MSEDKWLEEIATPLTLGTEKPEDTAQPKKEQAFQRIDDDWLEKIATPLKSEAGNVFLNMGRQALAGVDDITSFITAPLERTLGTVSVPIGEGKLEYLTPKETIQRRREKKLGIPGMAPEEPKGMFERAARFGGETAAVGPLLGRAAQAVKGVTPAATKLGRAKQFPRKIAHQAGQTFKRAPIRSTAAEVGLGMSAGATGWVAGELVPDSDAAVFIGDILGGVLPAVMPANLIMRAREPIKNMVKKAVKPFTGKGGEARAIGRIQRATTEPQRTRAIRGLERPTTIDPETGKEVLTPMQRTGTEGLLELEKSFLESSENIKHFWDEKIARANQVIQQSLRETGTQPSSTSAAWFKGAQKHLSTLLDYNLNVAAKQVDRKIAALGPQATREQANIIAREELGKVLDAAVRQEKELYGLIPGGTAVKYGKLAGRVKHHLEDLGKAQLKDIPPEARRALNEKAAEFLGEGGNTTAKDLRALQSKLRQTARQSRATGPGENLNKARIADDLADAITEDIGTIKDPKAVEAVKVAVAFTKAKKKRLSQGAVGRLLGRKYTGEPLVRPGLSLEQSIGMKGPQAREGMDEILKAFDSPEAPENATVIEAAKDYIRGRFLKETVKDGKLNKVAAERFLSDHEELLNRFPGLKGQMDESIRAGEVARIAQQHRKNVRFDDPKISKATLFIQQGPETAFQNISKLNPLTATRMTQMLVNRAKRDATGDAMQGLKSGFVDFLLTNAKEAKRDVSGLHFISGYALQDALANPSVRLMSRRILNESERRRLQTVAKDLIDMEKWRSAKPSKEGMMGDQPGKIVKRVMGIIGAAAGRTSSAQLGVGGTVQIPGQTADIAREFAAARIRDPGLRLIRDSIFDEKLLREYLEAPVQEGTQQISKKARRRLQAWLVAVLEEHGEPEMLYPLVAPAMEEKEAIE